MSRRILDSFPQTTGLPDRCIRLGLQAAVFSGGTPKKNNLDYWTDGVFPWIGSGEVNQGLITKPTAYITAAAVSNSSTKLFPVGSIAMALAGQGKTKATVGEMGIDAYGNQSLVCISKFRGSNRFLFWWLTSLYSEVRALSSQDTRDGLNQAMIGQLPVPLIPLELQTSIASFLDQEIYRIDQVIEKKQGLLGLLDEKRSALVNSEVTGQADRGSAGEAFVSESKTDSLHSNSAWWSGFVPSSWHIHRVRDCFEIINGYPFSSDKFNSSNLGLPLVRIRDLKASRLSTFYDGIEGLDTQVVEGDIVIGMDGDFNMVWWTGNSALLNQRVCALRAMPKSPLIARFSFYQLGLALKVVNDLTPQSTVKHLSSMSVLNLRLPAPDRQTQVQIANYLDTCTAGLDKVKVKVCTSIDRVQEFRASLITAALAGQIDICSWRRVGKTSDWLDQIDESNDL